jgi:hypothetical protein
MFCLHLLHLLIFGLETLSQLIRSSTSISAYLSPFLNILIKTAPLILPILLPYYILPYRTYHYCILYVQLLHQVEVKLYEGRRHIYFTHYHIYSIQVSVKYSWCLITLC